MSFDIQGDGLKAVFQALSLGVQAAAKGGKYAYNKHKGNQQAAEIEAYTQATTQPDLPAQLSSDYKDGVIFGKWKGKYLIKQKNIDGHVLVVGGSGSGKSTCIAIPTLEKWLIGAFAIDIKGELYEVAGSCFSKVFNPFYEGTYGYDPFWTLYDSDNPAQEARAIAEAVIPKPHDIKDPFWLESAQSILTGAILHYSGQSMSFLDTIRAIQSTAPKDLIQEILQSGTQEARYCVNSLVDIADKTLAGIMSELSRHVVVFVTDKYLISALSYEENIHPSDLEDGKSIFIQVPEHLLNQWKPLLTMMVNQFIRYFEQRESNDNILFLLDEFPRLGKIEAITNALATLRSRKVTICLLIQSLAQLDDIYGRDKRRVITDNCAYQAILSANDSDTQEAFSKLIGTWDRPKKSYGKNLEIMGLIGGMHEGTHFEKSPIIKPEELRQLGNDVIVLTPYGYCRVEKAPYYMEK